MKILILTDNRASFETFAEESPLEILFTDMDSFSKIPVDITLGYLDQETRNCSKNCRQILQELKAQANIPWGLLDFKRKLKDPMQLILHGWSDYLCGKQLLKNLHEERLHNILYFFHNKRPVPQSQELTMEGEFSGEDWTSIEDGKEYIFGMLYIEMIHGEELSDTVSESEINRLQKEWEKLLQDFFDPWFGYLWISNSWANILLFPFDGKKLHALEGVLEFQLNVPTFKFKMVKGSLQYKQVLHLGKTQFRKRHQTSHLVSESLNDLFHMGMYHAQPGHLYLTENVCSLMPESLLPLLDEPILFEGRKISRFRELQKS